MTMEELIRHPSMQREFSRFHSLGGQIIVKTNKIVLDAANVIPISIAEIFIFYFRGFVFPFISFLWLTFFVEFILNADSKLLFAW